MMLHQSDDENLEVSFLLIEQGHNVTRCILSRPIANTELQLATTDAARGSESLDSMHCGLYDWRVLNAP